MVCKPIVNSNYTVIPNEMASLCHYGAQELALLLIYWSVGDTFRVRHQYIADRTGWADRTIKKYRSSLVKKGFIYLVPAKQANQTHGVLLFTSPEHRTMFEYKYGLPETIDYDNGEFIVDGASVPFDVIRGAITDAYIEGLVEAERLASADEGDRDVVPDGIQDVMKRVRKKYGEEFDERYVATAYGKLIDPNDGKKLRRLTDLLSRTYVARRLFGGAKDGTEEVAEHRDALHNNTNTIRAYARNSNIGETRSEEKGSGGETGKNADDGGACAKGEVEAEAKRLAAKLDAYLQEKFTFYKPKASSLEKWAVDIRRMVTIDSIPVSVIDEVLDWIFTEDDFWWMNIRSGKKLRVHFPRIYEQMRKSRERKGLLPYLLEKFGADVPFAKMDGKPICVHDRGGGVLEIVEYNTGKRLSPDAYERIKAAWRAGKI